MTVADKLSELSGLSSVSAIDHIQGLGDFGAATTGEQLQAASPLGTATAIEHLVAIVQVIGELLGRIKVYLGGQWVKKPIKINGVTYPLKYFNGTSWVKTS